MDGRLTRACLGVLARRSHRQLARVVYKRRIGFISILADGGAGLRVDFIRSHCHGRGITVYILISISSHIGVRRSLRRVTRTTRRTDRSGSVFLTAIDRRLQAPLCNVVNGLSLLRAGRLPGNISQLIATVGGSSDLLLGVVDSVLSFSGVRSRRLGVRPHRFSPHRIVGRVATGCLPLIMHGRLNLCYFVRPSIPITLGNSPVHLRRIVSGLLDGTVGFASANYVILRIHTSNSCLSVHIHSANIKVPTGRIIHLFSPFFRIKANMRQGFRKANLNLTVYRGLVDVVSNSVSMSSRPKVNDRFAIHVPLCNTRCPRGGNIRKLDNGHY